MKKIFGTKTMRWPVLLLFAAAAGLYTGLVLSVPALEGTSFQDIGIAYEWWVIFGVIVAVHSPKSWGSALRCFVFFLVSQPIIYGVRVLVGAITVDMATYYLGIWGGQILLTLPGGFIAYFCKKQTAPGAVVLGLGNTIIAVMGVSYFAQMLSRFPYHLLSLLVCIASIFIMTFCIQKKKTNRIIALAVPLALTAAVVIYALATGRSFY